MPSARQVLHVVRERSHAGQDLLAASTASTGTRSRRGVLRWRRDPTAPRAASGASRRHGGDWISVMPTSTPASTSARILAAARRRPGRRTARTPPPAGPCSGCGTGGPGRTRSAGDAARRRAPPERGAPRRPAASARGRRRTPLSRSRRSPSTPCAQFDACPTRRQSALRRTGLGSQGPARRSRR